MSELLLEIGCEEIPARMLPTAISDLRERLTAALATARLAFERIECCGTPRRLMAGLHGLAERQAAVETLRRGPPVAGALDAEGRPSRAAQGFAASCGVTVEQLARIDTPKGSYLAYQERQEGEAAGQILPALVAELLRTFPWPKSMRWGAGEARFVRPILSLTLLLDGRVLPFVLPSVGALAREEIRSGDQVAGHRFMAPGPFRVSGIADYLDQLRRHRVIPGQEERQEIIWSRVEQLARQAGGEARPDVGLLAENGALTEWPVPLLGRFDPVYLEIPPEVLVVSMRSHQKYFAVQGAAGQLLPYFVVVANIEAADPELLLQGYQRVLKARLEDAAFYWQEDRRRPLADYRQALAGVVFQARLGTLGEKSDRIRQLVGVLAARCAPTLREELQRAAELCKCDLVTGILGEFPELQGVMGGYYATAAGESPVVARAIREHYLPAGEGDHLPTSLAGLLLSLADKLDTLTGCFAVGLEPTGAKDPFALRRAALGVIRLLAALSENPGLWPEGASRSGESFHLPLRTILAEAHAAYPAGRLDKGAKETVEAILSFIYGRLKVRMKNDGLDYDVIEAVQAIGLDDLTDVAARVRVLQQFKEQPAYAALVAANKRIANILEKEGIEGAPPAIVEELLVEPAEQALYAAVRTVIPEAAQRVAVAARAESAEALVEYAQALTRLATLREVIDRFFDQVLVMDKNEELQRNRKGVLAEVRRAFALIADISRLQLPESGA